MIRLHEPLGVSYKSRDLFEVRGVSLMLNSITPFFIVDDLSATIAFYQSKLGFNVRYKGGGDGFHGTRSSHAEPQGDHA